MRREYHGGRHTGNALQIVEIVNLHGRLLSACCAMAAGRCFAASVLQPAVDVPDAHTGLMKGTHLDGVSAEDLSEPGADAQY